MITLQTFGNFIKAIINHASDGFKNVSKEERTERLKICLTCELNRKSDWVCTHENCGCFLEKKSRWKSEDCPLGKWPKPGELPAFDEQQAPIGGCGCGSQSATDNTIPSSGEKVFSAYPYPSKMPLL